MSCVNSLTRPVTRRLVFSTSSQYAEPCCRTTRILSKKCALTNTNRCKIAFDWKRTDLTFRTMAPDLQLFLAQFDTIKILMKGLFDFLSMLGLRPRLLNIRIA